MVGFSFKPLATGMNLSKMSMYKHVSLFDRLCLLGLAQSFGCNLHECETCLPLPFKLVLPGLFLRKTTVKSFQLLCTCVYRATWVFVVSDTWMSAVPNITNGYKTVLWQFRVEIIRNLKILVLILWLLVILKKKHLDGKKCPLPSQDKSQFFSLTKLVFIY